MKNSTLIHDMIRICPQTGQVLEEQAQTRSIAELSKASTELISPRNAYVSLQVIIGLAEDSVSPIRMKAEAVKGDGDEIAPESMAFYAEWYHQVKGRYYPDALVPLEEGDESPRSLDAITKLNAIPDQNYAAVWVDLFVPADLRAGDYEGAIVVQSASRTDRLPFHLRVLETVVPDESLLIADLNSYADNLSIRMKYLRDRPERYEDGTYLDVERQFFRMAHEHRCLLHYLPYEQSGYVPPVYVPELEGKGKEMRVKDWSRFDEHYGPYLDGSAFAETKRGPIPLPYMYLPFNFHWPADYTKFGLKGYRTEFQTILQEFHRHFTERGWLKTKFELFLNHKKRYKLFPYDGDETRFMWDEKINDIYYDLAKEVLENEEGASFVFRSDSSWSYGLHFEKYGDKIKLWVVNHQIFSWFPESLEVLRSQGCEIWTYGGAQVIGQNLLETVISPLTAIARGVDGFVYWENTDWGDNWHVTPASDGSAALFYPGDELFGILGPIPSIRLKTLRSAMQAADCMEQWIRGQEGDGRKTIGELIARSLGVEPAAWWPGKPDFLDKPPYEWSGQMFSEAPRAALNQNQSPEAFLELKQQLWNLLG